MLVQSADMPYLLCGLPAVLQYNCVHPKTNINDAMEEAKMVTCGAIEGLLKKQGA